MMPFASPYGAPLYWSFHERPEAWHIDTFHHYAKQLAFFGGGRFTHSQHFHDSSLYGNHGVLTNMAPATDWVRELGRSMTYHNGAAALAEYIAFSAMPTFDLTTYKSPFTMSSWICSPAFESDGGGINFPVFSFGTANFQAAVFGLNQSRVNLYGDSNGTYNWNIGVNLLGLSIGSTAVTSTNVWHHIAVTRDSSGLYTAHLNGTPDGTRTLAANLVLNDTTFKIGAHYSLNRSYDSNGWIGDPCIWSRALTPSEISALADPDNVMLSLGGSDLGLIVPDDLVYPVYLPSSVVAGAKPALWLGVCV